MADRVASGTAASAAVQAPLLVGKGKVVIEVSAVGGNCTYDVERSPDGGTTYFKVDENGGKATRSLVSGDRRVLAAEEFENPANGQNILWRLNFTALSAGTAPWRLAQ